MIDILLATYNGELYLHQQINSIISQTFQNWRLLIHDDGSNDNTVSILREYAKKDPRIFFIEDNVECGGAGNNFLHIFKNYATADYIAFCDQDDFWLESKLELMWKTLSVEKEPAAIFAGGLLFTSQDGILGEIPSIKPKRLNELFFLSGGLQGCSLMINNKLSQLLKPFNGYMVMHDYLLTAGALAFGKIIYLNKKLMLYRQQHEGKVTANVDLSIRTRLRNKFPVIDDKHHKSLINFFDFYADKLNEGQKKEFVSYLKFYNSESILKKYFLIIKNRFKIDNSILYLLLKTTLRPTKN